METTTIVNEFIQNSIYRLELHTKHLKICFEKLNEDDMWRRPNESSNSIGNQIVHLCGNMYQYIQSSIGNLRDIRKRDEEFAMDGGMTKSDLWNHLTKTVSDAIKIIRQMDEASLTRVHSVQGFSYSGIGNVMQVVEHYAYHTGQIAFWTKLLKNKDLGFYAGIDLNKRNQHDL